MSTLLFIWTLWIIIVFFQCFKLKVLYVVLLKPLCFYNKMTDIHEKKIYKIKKKKKSKHLRVSSIKREALKMSDNVLHQDFVGVVWSDFMDGAGKISKQVHCCCQTVTIKYHWSVIGAWEYMTSPFSNWATPSLNHSAEKDTENSNLSRDKIKAALRRNNCVCVGVYPSQRIIDKTGFQGL